MAKASSSKKSQTAKSTSSSGGDSSDDEVPLYERIAAMVKRIPEGDVATYGQIARLVGTGPRIIGQALAAIDDDDVPWQRVVNSKGQLSLPGESGRLQRKRLREEGVLVQSDERCEGRLSLAIYAWSGPDDEHGN